MQIDKRHGFHGCMLLRSKNGHSESKLETDDFLEYVVPLHKFARKPTVISFVALNSKCNRERYMSEIVFFDFCANLNPKKNGSLIAFLT